MNGIPSVSDYTREQLRIITECKSEGYDSTIIENPKFSERVMRHVLETYRTGVSFPKIAKSIDSNQLFVISKYRRDGYSIQKIIHRAMSVDRACEIMEAVKVGIDLTTYAKESYDDFMLREIRLGLESGVDVSIYTTLEDGQPVFSEYQMKEIRLGLEAKLDVSKYAKPHIPHDVMRIVREGLEKEVDISHLLY